jgi:hypothetical protein
MLREEHGRYFPSADGQLATILNRTMGMLKCLVLHGPLLREEPGNVKLDPEVLL